jgi:phosphatidylserine synthase
MKANKPHATWVLWLFTVATIFFGAAAVYDLARGDRPALYEYAVLVMFAALAIDGWLKHKKGTAG